MRKKHIIIKYSIVKKWLFLHYQIFIKKLYYNYIYFKLEYQIKFHENQNIY